MSVNECSSLVHGIPVWCLLGSLIAATATWIVCGRKKGVAKTGASEQAIPGVTVAPTGNSQSVDNPSKTTTGSQKASGVPANGVPPPPPRPPPSQGPSSIKSGAAASEGGTRPNAPAEAAPPLELVTAMQHLTPPPPPPAGELELKTSVDKFVVDPTQASPASLHHKKKGKKQSKEMQKKISQETNHKPGAQVFAPEMDVDDDEETLQNVKSLEKDNEPSVLNEVK